MIRLDIHTKYRIKFMFSWLHLFSILSIISIFLFIFSDWYLCASILMIVYLFIGVITFFIGNRISKHLLYHYIILDTEYFEIEDKYGNIIRFDKKSIYPAWQGIITIFFDVFSYGIGGDPYRNFVDNDFSIDNGIDKIDCYISLKTYRLLKRLDYKYIFHQ